MLSWKALKQRRASLPEKDKNDDKDGKEKTEDKKEKEKKDKEKVDKEKSDNHKKASRDKAWIKLGTPKDI